MVETKLAVILEEIRTSRDGLDHICGDGGCKYAHITPETAEYETHFADPRPCRDPPVRVARSAGAAIGPGRDRQGRRPSAARADGFVPCYPWTWGSCGQERTCLAMNLLQGHEASCPHCWETISLTLDLSVPEQSYIEDCPVCCKPMLVSYSAADGELDALSVDPSD